MPVYGFPFLRRVSSAASACHLRSAKELSCRGAWIPLRAGFGRLAAEAARVATHGSERFLGLCVLCLRGRFGARFRSVPADELCCGCRSFLRKLLMCNMLIGRIVGLGIRCRERSVRSDRPSRSRFPLDRTAAFLLFRLVEKSPAAVCKKQKSAPDQRSADDQEPDPCRRRDSSAPFPVSPSIRPSA